jgi:hypothetical protein
MCCRLSARMASGWHLPATVTVLGDWRRLHRHRRGVGCGAARLPRGAGGKRDLTHGTTGRYHGLLHSGGRYAVKDPQSAIECIEENRILRRTHTHCIEDTSGFFVVTPEDEGDFPTASRPPAPTSASRVRRFGQGGTAPRAAAQPAHQPRLRGAGRLGGQLSGHARHRPGSAAGRRADSRLSRSDRPADRRRRRCAPHRRGAT